MLGSLPGRGGCVTPACGVCAWHVDEPLSQHPFHLSLLVCLPCAAANAFAQAGHGCDPEGQAETRHCPPELLGLGLGQGAQEAPCEPCGEPARTRMAAGRQGGALLLLTRLPAVHSGCVSGERGLPLIAVLLGPPPPSRLASSPVSIFPFSSIFLNSTFKDPSPSLLPPLAPLPVGPVLPTSSVGLRLAPSSYFEISCRRDTVMPKFTCPGFFIYDCGPTSVHVPRNVSSLSSRVVE